MKKSKLIFSESTEVIIEKMVVRELEKDLKLEESTVDSISKFMINHLPSKIKGMIPNITAVISRELSDTDINLILDKLLQDKETFQRIAQKLMDRLLTSRC